MNMKFSVFLLQMFKIGCIGFGGGSALIPVMEEEFIGEGKLDTKENFDRDVIVASLTPGALPIELASSIGRRNYGTKGMILGALAMALPGIFLTLCLVTLLSNFQSQVDYLMECVTVGISAFIIFLISTYIHNVWKQCHASSKRFMYRSVIAMIGVFILSCGKNLYKLFDVDRQPIFSVSTVCILLAAFFLILCRKEDKMSHHHRMLPIGAVLCVIYLLGHGKASILKSDTLLVVAAEILMILIALYCIYHEVRGMTRRSFPGRAIVKDLSRWAAFLVILVIPAVIASRDAIAYILKGMLSVLMSFGGGDAYLVIADGLFVEGGMVSEDIFYGNIVSVVNILPGSILGKALSAVGYYYGDLTTGSSFIGILFAIAGASCTLAISCGIFGAVYHMYDSLSESQIFTTIGRYIRPIISGLLGTVMLALCNQCKQSAIYFSLPPVYVLGLTFILVLVDFFFVKICHQRPIHVLGINLVAVFFIFGFGMHTF
jgi:chromate transporter